MRPTWTADRRSGQAAAICAKKRWNLLKETLKKEWVWSKKSRLGWRIKLPVVTTT